VILGIDTEGNFQKLSARVPLAELYKYATSLRYITQGRGVHSYETMGYALVSDTLKDAIAKELKATLTEE
jgi:elongation factor G